MRPSDPARAATDIGKKRYVWVVWKTSHQGPNWFKFLSTRPFRAP